MVLSIRVVSTAVSRPISTLTPPRARGSIRASSSPRSEAMRARSTSSRAAISASCSVCTRRPRTAPRRAGARAGRCRAPPRARRRRGSTCWVATMSASFTRRSASARSASSAATSIERSCSAISRALRRSMSSVSRVARRCDAVALQRQLGGDALHLHRLARRDLGLLDRVGAAISRARTRSSCWMRAAAITSRAAMSVSSSVRVRSISSLRVASSEAMRSAASAFSRAMRAASVALAAAISSSSTARLRVISRRRISPRARCARR